MAAKIVNLANPDEAELICATVEEAEQTFAAMLEEFRSQGYRVDEQHVLEEDYPQFTVHDGNDTWIGTYTIILQ